MSMRHIIAIAMAILITGCVPVVSADDNDTKLAALQMTATLENSQTTLDFNYAENINDGRGITFGCIGFCTGTYDGNELVKHYTTLNASNDLAQYITALDTIDAGAHNSAGGDGNPSVVGLDGFITDVQNCNDPLFKQAQIDKLDELYYNPAMQICSQKGFTMPLTKAFVYDMCVRHGPDGAQSIVDQATGSTETAKLSSMISIRTSELQNEGLGDIDRCDGYTAVLNAGNTNLNMPFSFTAYGESFTIDGNIGYDIGGQTPEPPASTGDQVAINTAIQGMTSGTLQLESRQYNITGPIVMKSNVDIRGTGPNTIIYAVSGDVCNSDSERAYIYGVGVSNVEISNMQFRSSAVGTDDGGHGNYRNCIQFRNSENCAAHDIVFTRYLYCDGVRVTGSNGVTVYNCTMKSTGHDGVCFYQSENCRMYNCDVEVQTNTGVRADGTTNTLIDHNTFTGTPGVATGWCCVELENELVNVTVTKNIMHDYSGTQGSAGVGNVSAVGSINVLDNVMWNVNPYIEVGVGDNILGPSNTNLSYWVSQGYGCGAVNVSEPAPTPEPEPEPEPVNPPENQTYTLPPSAGFRVSMLSGNAPLTVLFIDESINATSVSWDFGDGNTSTDRSTSHTYNPETTTVYMVTQHVSNNVGYGSVWTNITVNVPGSEPEPEPEPEQLPEGVGVIGDNGINPNCNVLMCFNMSQYAGQVIESATLDVQIYQNVSNNVNLVTGIHVYPDYPQSALALPSNGHYVFNATSIVQAVASGSIPNNAIVMSSSGTGRTMIYAMNAPAQYRPVLNVTYHAPITQHINESVDPSVTDECVIGHVNGNEYIVQLPVNLGQYNGDEIWYAAVELQPYFNDCGIDTGMELGLYLPGDSTLYATAYYDVGDEYYEIDFTDLMQEIADGEHGTVTSLVIKSTESTGYTGIYNYAATQNWQCPAITIDAE